MTERTNIQHGQKRPLPPSPWTPFFATVLGSACLVGLAVLAIVSM